jgi:Tfp pilus assembly protein PilV
MFKFNLKKNIKNGGFTLLEALVATSILMVAVAAPITIAQKGLSSAVYSKNQMIASYLAQDAIEYIKNKRDEAFIANNDWGGLSMFSKCAGSNGCSINTLDNVVQNAVSDETPEKKLWKDNTNGFYGYTENTGFTKTNFSRVIKIELQDVSGKNDKALITVRVSWGEDSNYVEVKTLIYNI